ncbi:dipeptidase PepV [Bacillus sp. FJAT-42376]|uniref:dipeptidase PepV n=1 Tax=Bacillus sp. FJAT-42376 TaxID=2014076 RepID=UPI000F4E9841|nr:dipeptidase PepV [Bacillus sp. FJAT-42376]AZB44020.1 dipeptidase PepV [Bacillus sp. FJAT-42376]
MFNWIEETEKRREQVIKDTQEFLRIKSVLDEDGGQEGAPFGKGIQEAFEHLLNKGEKDGFLKKNLEGYAGHLEMGKGDEILGILCHIDVVPEGDGWSSDPYGAEIRDGKIFARGALDDKGPTMAAYHAMKLVKDSGVELNKKVRMIIGTDEESDWRCVDHYFKHEQMPDIGFAPDADFPIIHAEKGIIDAKLRFNGKETADSGPLTLVSFSSGRRFNMVPDFAEAEVKGKDDFEEQFSAWLEREGLKGSVKKASGQTVLQIEGVSAHAMEPNNGKNAGVSLASFLSTLHLDEAGKRFTSFIKEHFKGDTRGEALGIKANDDVSGDLTVNLGTMKFSNQTGELGINVRYPVTASSEPVRAAFESIQGAELTMFNDSPSHYVEAGHPLIQTLSKVYEEQTGEKASLISIGGGTYARSLKAGVAFGPLFPGRPDIAHQKDEYIEIEDLIRATAIYAQAIYELAK